MYTNSKIQKNSTTSHIRTSGDRFVRGKHAAMRLGRGKSGLLQRAYTTQTVMLPGGQQQTTYTHTKPNSRQEFLQDFNAGRINIVQPGNMFFTVQDRTHNEERDNHDPIRYSAEWVVNYVTPQSQPPGIINNAPGNTVQYLHAHVILNENGDTNITNLHVKNYPAGGIAFALQPADANTLGLAVQLPAG